MDVLVHIFYIYFFPLGIVAYLILAIDFVTVALIGVPTEDGWEQAKQPNLISNKKKIKSLSLEHSNSCIVKMIKKISP